MGYVSVGLHVDPDDWQRPPAERHCQRVIEQVSDPRSRMCARHIILLHDGGGDRSQTVAALPGLIDSLRAKGYDFVTVSELAGLSRDQAMPPVPARSIAQFVSLPVFLTLSWLGHLLTALFFVAIGLGMARVAIPERSRASATGWRSAPRAAAIAGFTTAADCASSPPITKPRSSSAAVHHILASDYPESWRLSSSMMARPTAPRTLVREHFGDEPRVKLITMPEWRQSRRAEPRLGRGARRRHRGA